ncbi:acyl-CoA dehydrogenase family protein [Leptospira santarosai]|uniref:Acyl-CoA dehydrogenase, C-terminal domain protein n=1 Tax=Leptospira santarosai str. ZUN179 TaxID=1049985 RepID=M6VB99_9LEPT|nr:acyl-CoA dehydrogenase family protein [Leptospira santarosai]EKS09494.1 acyl-CoA dehydrogenase, C-terminal domain protein [Leptospira santarosai str. JET]EMM87748.1 acyl-CoA dehydrogenase, C-terminal domain protein [Leptospira santarosai str. 2000027870]EMO46803.1 acyl-CoA dehydrogenase, C-terminal domain protein [Leptospira santarosai str. ZUN179]EMO83126.1 acyl-CoA dehydrogenase, C-terminal domain protein [Leptospira santarosai str. AIM]KXZ32619.1 acyl-CoA dehydrogenase [Leptospira santar
MQYPFNQTANPGLAPFDISNYRGNRGKNFYEEDRVLQALVEKYSKDYDAAHKKAMIEHLFGYGALVGGVLDELTEASHKEGKYGEVVPYDRTGNRIDAVVYSNEQKLSRKISYDYGIVNLNYHSSWKHPFTDLHRYALAYLANQNGEGGVTCPLAMTEGMIKVLEALGTPKQKEKYLPLVAGEGSHSHFMAGQYVTERVGGSNVSANRTIARKQENGKWILTGEKWFCSNPGDLWVTTARVEDTNTIGLFLVPRIKEDGTLNGHHILRKKDIIGSRGKLTVEIIYDGVEAEALGRPAHGIANLIKYVIGISRLHVSIAASGISRRAWMEAYEYAKFRTAYGSKILEFPSLLKQLSDQRLKHTAMLTSIFRHFHTPEPLKLAGEVLAPLLKYKCSSISTEITYNSILVLGGNGIVGDFSALPRLHNDSIINETWEGTHLLLSEHVLRGFKREKVAKAFFKYVEEITDSNSEAAETIRQKSELLQSLLDHSSSEELDLNRIYVADLAFETFALAALSDVSGKNSPTFQKDISVFRDGYLDLINSSHSFSKTGSFSGNPERLKSAIHF